MMSLIKSPEVLEQFMSSVKAGQKPTVDDASGSAFGICMGDLQKIGWSERITTRYSMYWRYTGPEPIIVSDIELKPGDYTKEFDMDWS
jgi:hypothetical protein